ncbi:MAG: MFS transporter [SAR202 cluster bacterium]|nr:MFS transporter [SAR202 cluster bacterium]|tara:strand:- start:11833 stop:13071 length:1239 start_codon:yes stop_codon:yes gene_type:complete
MYRLGLLNIKVIPYHWWVVVLATLAMIGDGLVIQSIPVLYPFIREELDLTRAEVGLITSAIMGTSMISVMLGGFLSDIWGAKRVLIIVMIYTAFPVLALGLINSLWSAIIVGFLIGIGVGPFYPATSKQIMDWVPQSTRALGMSIKQTGPPVAGTLAAITLPVLALATTWRLACIFLFGSMIILTILVQLFYRDKKVDSSNERRSTSMEEFKQIAKDRNLVVLTIWAFCFVGLQLIVLSYLILFLVEELQYSEITAGRYLGMALFISVIARIFWGAASDFMFKGKRKLTLAIIGLIAFISLIVTSFLSPETPILIVVIVTLLLGASCMSWPGIFTAYVAEISGPDKSGTAIGVTNGIVRIGIIIMPPVFGHFVDTSDSYQSAWLITAAIAITSTILMFLLAKEPSRESSKID